MVTRSSSPPPPATTSCRLGLRERSLKYCLTEISWYKKNHHQQWVPKVIQIWEEFSLSNNKKSGLISLGRLLLPVASPTPPKYQGNIPLQRSGQALKETTLMWTRAEIWREVRRASEAASTGWASLYIFTSWASPACSLKRIFLSYLTQRRAFKYHRNSASWRGARPHCVASKHPGGDPWSRQGGKAWLVHKRQASA